MYHLTNDEEAKETEHLPMVPEMQQIAEKVTNNLGGSGLFGVEFFIRNNEVIFSELSPRPHDTGMVTLAGTQNFSEFELHARAILGIPINEITLLRNGASAVVLASETSEATPCYSGLKEAAQFSNTDFKIFGKPTTRKHRRMGVALSYGQEDTGKLTNKAKKVASSITVK